MKRANSGVSSVLHEPRCLAHRVCSWAVQGPEQPTDAPSVDTTYTTPQHAQHTPRQGFTTTTLPRFAQPLPPYRTMHPHYLTHAP